MRRHGCMCPRTRQSQLLWDIEENTPFGNHVMRLNDTVHNRNISAWNLVYGDVASKISLVCGVGKE